MSWQALHVFEPALPPQCEPATDFLYRFSSTFHTCVPTNLAFISTTLGTLSILSWLFAQLPQIYKNYSIKSVSGLSIYFLVEWCLGDLSNLLGAVFTHQASWQIIIAGYYCFVDFMLVLQWVWYEQLKHGRPLHRAWFKKRNNKHNRDNSGDLEEVVIDGMSVRSGVSSKAPSVVEGRKDSGHTPAKDIKDGGNARRGPAWRMPDFGQKDDEKAGRSPSSFNRQIYRVQPSSSMPSPSPRTVLLIACLITLARASPIQSSPTAATTLTNTQPTPLENAGTILSWLSTLLYLVSRLPQIYKNYRRQSTSGLSAHLFAAAFFGNLFYSTSILTNPCAWSDMPAYGGGGWVGADGNDRVEWVVRALPFWLGAAGVLGLDGAVGIQFMIYGERDGAKVVVVEEGRNGRDRKRWKRVSGWMRGWAPTFSDPVKISASEREALLTVNRAGEGTARGEYGTNA